ncbi:uncharacterized protein [Parasteatoda tepidariorum]|uniref:uncharacterized protein n=1 Tax=Parasteatoda tepidariorum TaxID=114398 RepID=UPI001C726070|nr:uncharacterized protein LOC122271086 [Parasteatoda tepidariorum]
MDIKNAFNSANWYILKRELNNLNLSDSLLAIVYDFLHHRSVGFNFNDTTIISSTNIGVPQGSSLGPVLWLILINSLLTNFNFSNSKLLAFADDIFLLTKNSILYQLDKQASTIIENLTDWAKSHKLALAPEKTFAITFPKGTKCVRRLPCIKMEGTNSAYIKNVKTLKYLGITLDPRLSWIPHLKNLKNEIIVFYDKIKQYSRATWGLNPAILKLIYKQAIEKKIIYGASVWYANKVKLNQKLISIQRIPLLNITKCYFTTSTEALQILAGITPIDLTIRQSIAIKQQFWNNNNQDTFDNDYQIKYLNEYSPPPNCTYDPTQLRIINTGYSGPSGTGYEIYTDGSRRQVINNETNEYEYKVGSGFLVKLNGETIHQQSVRINDESSIYPAELTAIYLAVSWAIEADIQELVLFSDSKSSLQALENPTPRDIIVENIKGIIQHRNYRFNWIKAHSGEAGNEEADALAKAGTLLSGVDFYYSITRPQLNYKLRQVSRDLWQERWDRSSNGRHTNKFFPKVSDKLLNFDFYVNQFYTAHGVFGEHQSRFFQKSSSWKYCGKSQTVQHLIAECPKFSTLRGNHIKIREPIEKWCRTKQQQQIIREIIKSTLEDTITMDDPMDPIHLG